ncbi:DUF721 domain-containing protein [Salinisphaera sp. USBA-960]|uniref:DciA family protein n=1 Tax=Salinisphaera orenii TaxID=856731 RepID=UPI000DBE9C84|nr:DUF721 domain-containing protein [Salifodinibacter halophilus]NNC26573.1 DUF721 domain-containing protein [Salifodinibacter halophilus]
MSATSSNSPRSLQAVLYAASGHTLRRASYLRRIHSVVASQLPPGLSDQVHTAGFGGARLRLHVPNGTLATRIRYLQPALARALARTHRLKLDTVDVKVRPDEFIQPPERRTKRDIPADVAQQMQSIAGGVNHPPLANALRQLAEAGHPTDNDSVRY